MATQPPDKAAKIDGHQQHPVGSIGALESRRLVFIVGSPRSGTTWLQLLLSQHPAVASGQETHLFSSYLDGFLKAPANAARSQRGAGLAQILSPQTYGAWVRRIAAEGLTMAIPLSSGTEIVLEKTPQHIFRATDIVSLFPEAYFLEVVRDPRAVIASMQAMARDGAHWAKDTPLRNALEWRDSIRQGDRLQTITERSLRVRYEDLHEDAAAVAEKIFDWLGRPISGAEARAFADAVSFKRLQSGAERAAPWDVSRDPAGFYRKGQTQSFRKDLSAQNISLIEAITESEMADLEYRPQRPRRPQWRLFWFRLLRGMDWRIKKAIRRL